MRDTGEAISPPGAETDGDLEAEFSYEELTKAILEDLGDQHKPRREDGWRTIAELMEKSQELSETQLRERLKRKVARGQYELMLHKKVGYFRIKRDGME